MKFEFLLFQKRSETANQLYNFYTSPQVWGQCWIDGVYTTSLGRTQGTLQNCQNSGAKAGLVVFYTPGLGRTQGTPRGNYFSGSMGDIPRHQELCPFPLIVTDLITALLGLGLQYCEGGEGGLVVHEVRRSLGETFGGLFELGHLVACVNYDSKFGFL